jgi:peroxiredoxin family protein
MSSKKLGILVVSGVLERVQMAAMVASVGAVSGSQVTVLLSMNSLELFLKEGAPQAAPEGSFGRTMSGKNVPSFKQLLQHAIELGDAKVHPCSMAMDVLSLKPEQLDAMLERPLGLTKFLSEGADGQMLTF